MIYQPCVEDLKQKKPYEYSCWLYLPHKRLSLQHYLKKNPQKFVCPKPKISMNYRPKKMETKHKFFPISAVWTKSFVNKVCYKFEYLQQKIS